VTSFGYHASHEQFSPADLLQYVQAAEQAGFDAAMCSDHFHPWTQAQGNSGFAWAWLGAALQATGLSFGTVSVPGYRYHPAVLAQAAATLAFMYPGRFWLALGSGEALNETITGERWPPKPERNERLAECVEIMRALWAGETVSHRGGVVVEEATLFTRPPNPPMVVGAALTPETARWVGGWADGLITIAHPLDELKELLDGFRDSGGDKPAFLQFQLSFGDSDAQASRVAAEQWPIAMLASDVLAQLRRPEQFEAATQMLDGATVANEIPAHAQPARFVDEIGAYAELGFERIYLHNVGPDQQRFIETFGERVLPELRRVAATVG